MQKPSLLLLCTLVFGLILAGCGTKGTLIEASWITQEEMQGNAKWNAAYQRFFDAATPGPIIPGLAQGFVPQGIDYLASHDWLLISGYRDGASSLVTIIDAKTEKHVKTLQFRNRDGRIYNAHAGGVALSDKYLWISSGGQVHYAAIEDVIKAADGDIVPFAGHLPVDARGSFVAHSDGILWVGDFALDTRYPTEPHHHLNNRVWTRHRGWIAGYILDPTTNLIPTSQPRMADGTYIPDMVLSIRDMIQGVEFLDDRIVLTESFGRNNNSHLFIYRNPLGDEPHRQVTVGNQSVPVWFLDPMNLIDTWVLPPMVESVAERHGQIYINFESAAQKFLDGSYALSRLQIVDRSTLLGK